MTTTNKCIHIDLVFKRKYKSMEKIESKLQINSLCIENIDSLRLKKAHSYKDFFNINHIINLYTSYKNNQIKTIKCFKDITDLLNNKSQIDGNDYTTYFEKRLVSIITNLKGSMLLQNNIEKFSPFFMRIYDELKGSIVYLLKQTYSNYFIQILLSKLPIDKRSESINLIVDNIDVLIKNLVSFKAIICMFELPMSSYSQLHLMNYLRKIDTNYYLIHTRYLKILESILTSFDEVNLDFIIQLVAIKVDELIVLKQGYFLIRKLIKKIQSVSNFRIILLNVIQNFKIYNNTENGILKLLCLYKTLQSHKNNTNSNLLTNKIEVKSFTKKVLTSYSGKESLLHFNHPSDEFEIKEFSQLIKIYLEEYLNYLFNESITTMTKEQNKFFDLLMKSKEFHTLLIKKLIENKDNNLTQVMYLLEKLLNLPSAKETFNEYFEKEMENYKRNMLKYLLEELISSKSKNSNLIKVILNNNFKKFNSNKNKKNEFLFERHDPVCKLNSNPNMKRNLNDKLFSIDSDTDEDEIQNGYNKKFIDYDNKNSKNSTIIFNKSTSIIEDNDFKNNEEFTQNHAYNNMNMFPGYIYPQYYQQHPVSNVICHNQYNPYFINQQNIVQMNSYQPFYNYNQTYYNLNQNMKISSNLKNQIGLNKSNVNKEQEKRKNNK